MSLWFSPYPAGRYKVLHPEKMGMQELLKHGDVVVLDGKGSVLSHPQYSYSQTWVFKHLIPIYKESDYTWD